MPSASPGHRSTSSGAPPIDCCIVYWSPFDRSLVLRISNATSLHGPVMPLRPDDVLPDASVYVIEIDRRAKATRSKQEAMEVLRDVWRHLRASGRAGPDGAVD